MTRKKPAEAGKAPAEQVELLIHEIRSERVILDTDLARLYGVTTKRLNQQVKRNLERFPADFLFQLTVEESKALKSQIAISNSEDSGKAGSQRMRLQIATASKRNVRFLPYAFTEHGAIMAANVLNSPRAVQMSIFVVRAFLKMRGLLTGTREMARKLAALEEDLKGRLDVHEAAIVTILQRVMEIIDPPPAPPEPEKPKIGFQP